MTDVELGYALYPEAPHVGAWIAHRSSPARRATLDRMVTFGDEWNLYAAGIALKPDMNGVIVTRARGKFRGQRHD